MLAQVGCSPVADHVLRAVARVEDLTTPSRRDNDMTEADAAPENALSEEAIEEVEAKTGVSDLSVGFNVNYLLDALGALGGEEVLLCLRDGQSSCLVRKPESDDTRHVIMPLRL